MKRLFDELAYKLSKVTTEKYSTSFSLGITALHPDIRPAIYATYGYVRLADEIVDSFHGYDKRTLLLRFKQHTGEALDEKISVNPILHAFQETVHRYKIDRGLVDRFLQSMEMDLEPVKYNAERYQQYIVGSAEVVGLMCLKIFVSGDEALYDSLKPSAMKLGAAFQKVNFLRDMKEDYHLLGRTYFPELETDSFDDDMKEQIQSDIHKDFQEGLSGIRKLPDTARFGVYLAYRYYHSLFEKIKKTPASTILQKRVRIPNGRKASLIMTTYLRYKLSIV